MLHIITNHHKTLKWLDIQSNYLHKNTKEEYKVYCGITDINQNESLEQIRSTSPHLDRYSFYELNDVVNRHADKMNALFNFVEPNLPENDLLVFLDPDALPIKKDWDQAMNERMKKASLPVVAISREENPEPLLRSDQKPYPHPCFLFTDYKFWKENDLSWDLDPTQGADCAGVLLKKWLDKNEFKWGKILRTNCFNLHPLNFGVYGNIIYHHGSGNRPTYDSIDIWSRPELASKYGVGLDLHFPELLTFNDRLSNLVFDEININYDFIRMYFCGKDRE